MPPDPRVGWHHIGHQGALRHQGLGHGQRPCRHPVEDKGREVLFPTQVASGQFRYLLLHQGGAQVTLLVGGALEEGWDGAVVHQAHQVVDPIDPMGAVPVRHYPLCRAHTSVLGHVVPYDRAGGITEYGVNVRRVRNDNRHAILLNASICSTGGARPGTHAYGNSWGKRCQYTCSGSRQLLED